MHKFVLIVIRKINGDTQQHLNVTQSTDRFNATHFTTPIPKAIHSKTTNNDEVKLKRILKKQQQNDEKKRIVRRSFSFRMLQHSTQQNIDLFINDKKRSNDTA